MDATWQYPCSDAECECSQCSHMVQVFDSPYENQLGETVYPGMCTYLSPPETFEIPAAKLEAYLRSDDTRTTLVVSPASKSTASQDGFTAKDRKKVDALYDAVVRGKEPTQKRLAGDVRKEQITYGLGLYKQSSKHVKGVSFLTAARRTINADRFKDAEGGYKMGEVKSLAQAIRRAFLSPKE